VATKVYHEAIKKQRRAEQRNFDATAVQQAAADKLCDAETSNIDRAERGEALSDLAA
jgi:hypothetical protein